MLQSWNSPRTAKSPLYGAFSTRPERFELPTFGSVDRRSIQLSYGREAAKCSRGDPHTQRDPVWQYARVTAISFTDCGARDTAQFQRVAWRISRLGREGRRRRCADRRRLPAGHRGGDGEGGIRTRDRGFPPYSLSRRVPSATRPPLRRARGILEQGRAAHGAARIGSAAMAPATIARAPGGVAEWSNAPVLKTGEPARVPRVRIPPPPSAPPRRAHAERGKITLLRGPERSPGPRCGRAGARLCRGRNQTTLSGRNLPG